MPTEKNKGCPYGSGLLIFLFLGAVMQSNRNAIYNYITIFAICQELFAIFLNNLDNL